jgi:hypothetical protein
LTWTRRTIGAGLSVPLEEANTMTMEHLKAAFDQEWNNVRYQDGLRWSKFQTIAAIEGGFLAALYVARL